MTEDDGVIASSLDGPVATVVIDRPAKRNAMTAEMQRRFSEVLRERDADPATRVIVVTGAGSAFCSGGDTSKLADRDLMRSYRPGIEDLPLVGPQLRTPVVAAINGPAAGIGVAILASCDVRFIAADAVIIPSFARLGLTAEYGLSWLFPRLVGLGRAMEILLSGRAVDAAEAERIGLAHAVVRDAPVLAVAQEWAARVAARCSPRSLALIKAQLYSDQASALDETVRRAVGIMLESFGWDDLYEAMDALAARRAPVFDPLPSAFDVTRLAT